MRNLYTQCHDAASGFVTSYFTDVTTYDRDMLAEYDGDIIYAMRETGTNLILLDGEPRDRVNVDAVEVFTFQSNTRFFASLNGDLQECTKAYAWSRWTAHRDAIAAPVVHHEAP